MLFVDNSVLIIVDVQEKLTGLMSNRESLYQNLCRMVEGVNLLQIPIIITEQKPDKLGTTIPELQAGIKNVDPIAKESFSCYGSDKFKEILKALNRTQIILTGIETHICVFQTARDLIDKGFEVHVVIDAVSSRSVLNHQCGLDRIKAEGGFLGSTELILFEWVRVASGEVFRKLVKIVK